MFPEKRDLQERIGEVWLTAADCKIASDLFTGKTLGSAWLAMPAEWRGRGFGVAQDFPLLIKFIFTDEKLSIQVHPDDAYAAVHEKAAGGRGKTELWHALKAEDGAEVLLGLREGVGEKEFRAALNDGSTEKLFERRAVRAGDTFFVTAGTPHTIGAGLVLCEVQQYSDLTYRIYDYGRVEASGRPRELHLNKAMEAIKFGKTHAGKVDAVSLPTDGAKRSLLAACQQFATERLEFSRGVAPFEKVGDRDRFELVVILSGGGSFKWEDGAAQFAMGQCWFLPATLEGLSVSVEDATVLLRSFVPDLGAVRADGERKGITRAQLERVIFD
ncbi:MAG: class I mannose-6-phosphate isomerase [Candidatus Acidiferrum sp.]